MSPGNEAENEAVAQSSTDQRLGLWTIGAWAVVAILLVTESRENHRERLSYRLAKWWRGL